MAQGTRSLRRGELLAILGEIYRDKETGTLVLQQGQVSKFLYAQEGNLIFAASNSPEDKFTQILIDQGKLTNEQLAMAQDKKENRTIGRTLVELGFLASEDLLDALVSQMRKIASSVLNWESGFAAFKPGILPPNLAKLPIATPRFIVDTALTLADREWAAASLGRLEIPIQMDESHREMAKGLNPTADEMRLLGTIDGNRTARQICLDADVNLFDGVRFLIGLYYLGWIVLEQAVVAAPAPSKPKGTVDLSFLDKVAPAPPAAAHPVGEVPVTPQRIQAPPRAPGAPEPSNLPFDTGTAQEELKTTPEPLPPPPAPPAEPPAPRAPEEEPVDFVPPSLAEPVSRPDLLPPLGEEEEGEEEALPLEKPAVKPLTFTALQRPEPKPWGMILGILAGVVVLGAALAVAGWWFFLRPKPQPVPPPRPPVAKPAEPKPAEPKPGPAPGPAPANQPANSPVLHLPPSTGVKPPVAKPPEPKPVEPKPGPTAPKPPEPRPEPAAAGAASLDEGRRLLEGGQYRQAAQTFQRAMSSKRGGFTINVEVACQDETVAKGLAAAGSDPAFIILPYSLKGRPCYRVIWGHYPDRASAEEAMRGLPEFFKHGASPQIAAWK